jgi:hypothetical protein
MKTIITVQPSVLPPVNLRNRKRSRKQFDTTQQVKEEDTTQKVKEDTTQQVEEEDSDMDRIVAALLAQEYVSLFSLICTDRLSKEKQIPG